MRHFKVLHRPGPYYSLFHSVQFLFQFKYSEYMEDSFQSYYWSFYEQIKSHEINLSRKLCYPYSLQKSVTIN